jgi:YfiH family protein
MQRVEPLESDLTGLTDWLIPDWPVHGSVRAVCTTRSGGVSEGRYASLNLGDHVGDDPVSVATNRQLLHAAIGVRPVFLQQVHDLQVQALDSGSVDGAQADACTTTEHDVACTIMVADCLPVLFATADGSHVGAAHAGWRGLAAGVLERTVDALGSNAGLVAWLGPCIGPRAFEVGDEVRSAFVATLPAHASCFRPAGLPGKWLADLPALARQRLAARGITQVHGNDGTDDWCTVRNPSRFFSHRRDGVSGRFAACVWRVCCD